MYNFLNHFQPRKKSKSVVSWLLNQTDVTKSKPAVSKVSLTRNSSFDRRPNKKYRCKKSNYIIIEERVDYKHKLEIVEKRGTFA